MSGASTSYLREDGNLLTKIQRIRERYGILEGNRDQEEEAPSSSSPKPIMSNSTEGRLDLHGKPSHHHQESVDDDAVLHRLELTVQKLQQRNTRRSETLSHLDQLMAAMNRPLPTTSTNNSNNNTTPANSNSSNTSTSRHTLLIQSSSPPLLRSFQPRRAQSQCRSPKILLRLTVPLLLRFPILFPSVDTAAVNVVFTLDSFMESTGDDVALKLLEQVSAHIVLPSLQAAQEMDASAAFVAISLRGVREVLQRLKTAAEATCQFAVVFPTSQRKSCLASVASAVEDVPDYITLEGPSPLYEDERLRIWSQRLWALLRLGNEDDASLARDIDEGPIIFDMFLFEKESLRNA